MPSANAMGAPISEPETQYDAWITDPNSKTLLSPTQLAQRLASTDVVVVGEYHGHHGSHLLQSGLQAALHSLRPEQILSME